MLPNGSVATMPSPTANRPLLVGLLGGESTGKSDLARDLATRCGGIVAEEVLRRFAEAHRRPPRPDEQGGVLEQQVEAMLAASAAAASNGLTVAVSDPAPLMTAVYSVLYYDDESLIERGLQTCADFDLLMWCWPDIDWVADPGQRDGPRWRMGAHQVLESLERRIPMPVTMIRGSGEPRSTAAVQAVEDLRRRLA